MTLKSLLLAAGAVVAGASAAHAQVNIYGNGASLPAPYWRQALNCYQSGGTKEDLVSSPGIAWTATTGNPANISSITPITDFNFQPTRAGVQPLNCATQGVDTGFRGNYISTGSGRGIRALFGNDELQAGDVDGATAGFQTWNGLNASSTNAQSIHYAVSETSLGQSDVDVYNFGTGRAADGPNGIPATPATVAGTSYNNILSTGANGSAQGIGVRNPTAASPGVAYTDGTSAGTAVYPNPRASYGPLIQHPLLIAPVTVSFDPVYRKYNNPGNGGATESYSLQLPEPITDDSGTVIGGINLTVDALCRLFAAQNLPAADRITNWNDSRLTGGNSVRDPADVTQSNANFSVPIQIVGRSDSSGTTTLWTRHLARVCDAVVGTSSNPYGAAGTGTLPTATRPTSGGVYVRGTGGVPPVGETIGRYTTAPGNEGVAEYVDFARVPSASQNDTAAGLTFNGTVNPADVLTQGRIGYMGPDYVLPASTRTGSNNYGLVPFSVENSSGTFVLPTPDAASAAFGGITPPTGANAANPANWVASVSELEALADPTDATAYPIVGTSNFLAYSCYRFSGVANRISAYMNWYLRQPTVNAFTNQAPLNLLTSAGLSPLPLNWRDAIRTTFYTVTSGGAANPLALRFTRDADGGAGETSQCAGLVGGINGGA